MVSSDTEDSEIKDWALPSQDYPGMLWGSQKLILRLDNTIPGLTWDDVYEEEWSVVTQQGGSDTIMCTMFAE